MQARAPGKLVLSGAYAVLSGAPAIVSAVDRFAFADAARRADRPTPEVSAALGGDGAPYFDATELRESEKKLGLGSSASILVASLGARMIAMNGPIADDELRKAILPEALAAHARAQGGGSGVDVAAAVFGGTMVYRRGTPLPTMEPVELPPGLVIETWWSGKAAITAELVGRVNTYATRDPMGHTELMARQSAAAEAAEVAVKKGSREGFIAALAEQRGALAALGRAAATPIVVSTVEELASEAERTSATVLPAGAGGGDIVLHVGPNASTPEFRELAQRHGHRLLALALGARGLHGMALGGGKG